MILDPDAAEIIFAATESLAQARAVGLHTQLEDLIAVLIKKSGSTYLHPRPLPWADQEMMWAHHGLRIDVNGMLHHLNNPKIVAPSKEQAQFYLTQINKALEAIGEISPQALSLIQNFTHTVHLRQNPHHHGFSSWSTHIGIGKIVASNFDDVAGTLAEVMDFLIHESIHNFLHLVEEHYGPFLEDEAYTSNWIKEKIVASPWSGKKIDLGSYTHAIGVWYGLAQFWIRAQGYRGRHASELGAVQIEKMARQASKGFLKPGNVHTAAGTRFHFMNKDYLAFSLQFQAEISCLRRGVQIA